VILNSLFGKLIRFQNGCLKSEFKITFGDSDSFLKKQIFGKRIVFQILRPKVNCNTILELELLAHLNSNAVPAAR